MTEDAIQQKLGKLAARREALRKKRSKKPGAKDKLKFPEWHVVSENHK